MAEQRLFRLTPLLLEAALLLAIAAAWQSAPAKQTSPQAMTDVTLPIQVVPTADGAGNTYTYKPSTMVSAPAELARQIAAYGARGRVWLGPKDWHGVGSAGADNSTDVVLRPGRQSAQVAGPPQFHAVLGAPANGGPYIEYTDDGACVGCIVNDAAVFFPAARESSHESTLHPPPAPDGIRVLSQTPNLVRFTLPPARGLPVHGVAFWVGPPAEQFFSQALFVLPAAQAPLAKFLEDNYAAAQTKLLTLR